MWWNVDYFIVQQAVFMVTEKFLLWLKNKLKIIL